MNKRGKGISGYFILIIGLLLLTIWVGTLKPEEESYTKANLLADLEAENIVEVIIQPNQQVPTGAVSVTIKPDENKVFYVLDTNEYEDLFRQYGLEPTVRDVPKQSWFLAYVLPALIVLVVVVFFFVIMNAQNAGGGGSSNKMMNFGKSRAKLSIRDGKIT